MLSESVRSRLTDAVVVGAGTMGKYYVKNLLALGYDPRNISITDVRTDAIAECVRQYPGIVVLSTLEAATDKARGTGVLFNCTNTSQHAHVLDVAMNRGCKVLFSEKPLVLERDLCRLNERFDGCVGCGYLINFSKAVDALLKYIADEGLRIAEFVSQWGKNRTVEKPRATVGSLEDEATHPLALALRLYGSPSPTSICVRGTMSRIPFVKDAAQRLASTGDPEYDLDPISTANVWMRLDGLHQHFDAFVTSSYVHDQNVRSVWVKLADASCSLHSCARLDFDVYGKSDVLTITRYHRKEDPASWTFPSGDKLLDQIGAFLNHAASLPSLQRLDPRTVLLPDAIRMVRISAAALNDDCTHAGVAL